MQRDFNTPVNPQQRRPGESSYANQPDETPRREGGSDSLAEAAPADSRADEKVIVNSQQESKVVNTDTTEHQQSANETESTDRKL